MRIGQRGSDLALSFHLPRERARFWPPMAEILRNRGTSRGL
jgi:hypothetical protein